MRIFSKSTDFSRVTLIILILTIAGASSNQVLAQELKSAESIKGNWIGTDGHTYNIDVRADSRVVISVSGPDEEPTVVPSFSPLQIAVTAPVMLNGLIYEGDFDPKGFEVSSNLGKRDNFNFYPKSIPLQVMLLLKQGAPDLSSRLYLESLDSREIVLVRPLIQIKWQGNDPPTNIEVSPSADGKEIRLHPFISIQQFINLTQQQIDELMIDYAPGLISGGQSPVIGAYPPEISERIFKLAGADKISTQRLVRDMSRMSDKGQRVNRLRQEIDQRQVKMKSLEVSLRKFDVGPDSGELKRDRSARNRSLLNELKSTEDYLYRWAYQEEVEGPYIER